MLEGFLYWSQVLESSHAYLTPTCMHIEICMHVCMYEANTREMTPKLDFNTKILLTSRIMHRFQRFLVFWKAEGLLFHLETTFPRCVVFVRSKTWHLWKVCLIYWTNASIPELVKFLSQNTGNIHFACPFNMGSRLGISQSSSPAIMSSIGPVFVCPHVCKFSYHQNPVFKPLTVGWRGGGGIASYVVAVPVWQSWWVSTDLPVQPTSKTLWGGDGWSPIIPSPILSTHIRVLQFSPPPSVFVLLFQLSTKKTHPEFFRRKAAKKKTYKKIAASRRF